MKNLEVKQFDFTAIDGLSDRQLNEHYKLYEGYVNKANELWNLQKDQKDFGQPNPADSEMRKVVLAESYAVNGAKLHKMYFENLNNQAKTCEGAILDAINRDFGCYDDMLKRLKDVAMSVRGWSILAYDMCSESLQIYGQDEHDKGFIVDAAPLLVVDVYEHAYLIDYGIDKAKYLDTVAQNINWQVVTERFEKVLSAHEISLYA